MYNYGKKSEFYGIQVEMREFKWLLLQPSFVLPGVPHLSGNGSKGKTMDVLHFWVLFAGFLIRHAVIFR